MLDANFQFQNQSVNNFFYTLFIFQDNYNLTKAVIQASCSLVVQNYILHDKDLFEICRFLTDKLTPEENKLLMELRKQKAIILAEIQVECTQVSYNNQQIR